MRDVRVLTRLFVLYPPTIDLYLYPVRLCAVRLCCLPRSLARERERERGDWDRRAARGDAEAKKGSFVRACARDGVRARGGGGGGDARGGVFVLGTRRRVRGRRFEDEDEDVGDGAWGFFWCASTRYDDEKDDDDADDARGVGVVGVGDVVVEQEEFGRQSSSAESASTRGDSG